MAYTAIYRKTSSGYMGQLVEWPQVVTEGKDLEECRKMLKDALREMTAAYKDDAMEIPGPVLYESIEVAS
jgi:mRNA interferase HicA